MPLLQFDIARTLPELRKPRYRTRNRIRHDRHGDDCWPRRGHNPRARPDGDARGRAVDGPRVLDAETVAARSIDRERAFALATLETREVFVSTYQTRSARFTSSLANVGVDDSVASGTPTSECVSSTFRKRRQNICS